MTDDQLTTIPEKLPTTPLKIAYHCLPSLCVSIPLYPCGVRHSAALALGGLAHWLAPKQWIDRQNGEPVSRNEATSAWLNEQHR